MARRASQRRFNGAKRLPPIHPREILKDELMAPFDLSINKLARELRVPPGRMGAIVNGKRAITADTALRLARYFGASAELWMNMQALDDLEVARDPLETRIAREVRERQAA
jgi:addiction module HigA family antidote